MPTPILTFLLAHPYVCAAVLLAVLTAPVWLGVVVIGERQVGLVVKKFSSGSLPVGRLVALDGEAGYQAETLAPGWHFGYWSWQYTVRKVPVTVIPQGEIGLVVAADGKADPARAHPGPAWCDCDNFQDAREFLTNGGEKGRQLGILTAGTYRINTALFDGHHRRQTPSRPRHDCRAMLHVHRVEPDRVGIVTTLDGAPIDAGEIAGPVVAGHDNFQNGQAFIEAAGGAACRSRCCSPARGT